MSLITIPNIFSAGATIIASQHNSNFSVISSDYNGNIDNTNISPSASISYSKLSLTNSIVNSDINSSAAIVGSKLDLSSPGNIGATSPGTGAFTTLKVGTTNQGDILYDNGTSLVRLPPGTSGQFLKTQGAAANPVWANNTMSLVSATTMTTVTNSGNITIDTTKQYFVIVNITTQSGADSLSLLFNNDTTAAYSYVYRGFDTSASAINANNSGTATAILMTNSVTPTTSENVHLRFYIYPQASGVSRIMNIEGKANGKARYIDFYGEYNPGATVTSFKILTTGGATMSGVVYLYSISLS